MSDSDIAVLHAELRQVNNKLDIGDDASRIGQLAEPVTARVIVYDANAGAPETHTITVPPGTWLAPESMFDKPY